MIAALADHLWQSLLLCSLCAGLAFLIRQNSALVRLWMWRICALQLLFPFALLFALGRWLGFPARHSADPVPEPLLWVSDALMPMLAPVQSAPIGSGAAAACLLMMLPATSMCVMMILRALRIENWLARDELIRREACPDDEPPGLGFFKGALLTFCAASIFASALVGGAIVDRRWRLQLLVTHAGELRDAPVTMIEAAPGKDARPRLEVNAAGVLIRNVSIQDLLAVAYGVGHFAVWSDQMISKDDPEARMWLISPRYDVRVKARISEPADFDAYALHQRITQYLGERFGFEIYVNGRCQPPCGTYRVPLNDSPL